jgi:hypothetical protein
MSNRNDPCPCSSGRKYKKCCGSEVVLCAQRREAEAKQRAFVRARAVEREKEQEERRRLNPGAFKYQRQGMPLAILAAAAMSAWPLSRLR